MKKPVIIAAVAAVVALSVAAIAFAATSGDSSKDSDTSSGGAAGGACPAADVPGISQEERDRCEELDSPGGGAPPLDETADDPVTDETPIPTEPETPVTPADPGADPQLPDGRVAEPAPIDGLDVRVAESFPPQYFLNVQAGLPSGCAEQYKHEVARDGNVITVTVLNSLPEGTDNVCTAIYGIYELNIALGSDFESGQTYTVLVNDQETTFTAQ
jgi:hypothetical protein